MFQDWERGDSIRSRCQFSVPSSQFGLLTPILQASVAKVEAMAKPIHSAQNPGRPLPRPEQPCYVHLLSSFTMIRSYKGISPRIPESCYVDESAQIIGDVALGEHASVWMNAVLRGDVHAVRIGAHSNVQDCSVLHGMKEKYGVYVGEYVTVGHSVTLHGCVVEDRCLIGMGVIILNGARVGAGSIIAAGTLIPENTVVEPGSLWMGSPGKLRRQLEAEDQEMILQYAKNYLEYKETYLKESKPELG